MASANDKLQAVTAFWESFGIPAYEENSIRGIDEYYDEQGNRHKLDYPYITFEMRYGTLDNPVQLTADVWYRNTSQEQISQKVEQIERAIGEGNVIEYNGGALFITKGNPFAQLMGDDADDSVQRAYIMLNAEYLQS